MYFGSPFGPTFFWGPPFNDFGSTREENMKEEIQKLKQKAIDKMDKIRKEQDIEYRNGMNYADEYFLKWFEEAIENTSPNNVSRGHFSVDSETLPDPKQHSINFLQGFCDRLARLGEENSILVSFISGSISFNI